MSCSLVGWCQSSWETFADNFSPCDENISLADMKIAIFSPREYSIKRTDTVNISSPYAHNAKFTEALPLSSA